MNTVNSLKFTKDHEWVKAEENRVTIGITDYAQLTLGQIVFVELPEEGAEFSAGDTLGTVESVKSVSDVYTPVAGKIVETNKALEESPEAINDAPFENWIAVLESGDLTALDTLMDETAYRAYCNKAAQ